MAARIDSGRINEYRFASRALEYGIVIAFPASEKLPYDFICDNGKKLFKVQVKSTRSLDGGRYRIKFNTGRGSSSRPYKEGDFDFMVVYIEPNNTWYVIPYDHIENNYIALYPTSSVDKGKYEHYRESWHLLTQFE